MILQFCDRKIPRSRCGVSGRVMRACSTLICLVLVLSACSAAPESQTQLGATDALGNANAARSASEAKSPASEQAVGVSSGPAASSSITTGSIRPSTAAASPPSGNQSSFDTTHTAKQRCEQLRQDGEVWQRTRKLAVLNRGEAGGRMADLHTPWTKENVTFYLAACNSRKAKSPATTEKGMNGSRIASIPSSGRLASVRD